MTPEQIQELIDYIKSMGEATLSKGFTLAMRQVYLDGVWLFVSFLVGLVLLYGGIRYGILAYNVKEHSSYSDEELGGTIVAGALLTTGALLFVIGLGFVSRLINPEWFAIEKILGLIPGG